MPTIAIFGAGKALGLATAHKFGREGFTVELVGRHAATLAPLIERLHSDSIDAHASVADLTDTDQALSALQTLRDRSGTPDVVVYSPGDVGRLPEAARDLTSHSIASWLPLNLLTPIDLINATLPAMVDRGSGSIIVTQGSAVRTPSPALASASIGQAALLNYLLALDSDVRPHGVRLTSLQISQLIAGSAAADLFAAGHFDDVESSPLPTVTPEELARTIWDLAHHDQPVEYAS